MVKLLGELASNNSVHCVRLLLNLGFCSLRQDCGTIQLFRLLPKRTQVKQIVTVVMLIMVCLFSPKY